MVFDNNSVVVNEFTDYKTCKENTVFEYDDHISMAHINGNCVLFLVGEQSYKLVYGLNGNNKGEFNASGGIFKLLKLCFAGANRKLKSVASDNADIALLSLYITAVKYGSGLVNTHSVGNLRHHFFELSLAYYKALFRMKVGNIGKIGAVERARSV